ncbi:MAG: MSHA biogenesis protein MshQ [Paraglaciecola sp.]|jgi:MSHA biogenesis protein MshQ
MIKIIKTVIALIIVCMLLQHNSAGAKEYVLPGDIGSSPFNKCSGSGGTYTCTSNVDVGKGNTLDLSSDVTLNIDGEFKVGDDTSVSNEGYVFNVNATKLHIDGAASMVFNNLTATGDVHIHKEANLTANVTSTGGEIKIDGGNNTINGDITANSGDLNIDSGSTVNGTCSPSNSQCTPLPSMDNPTVVSQTTYGFSVIISGTYSSSVATSLNVTVNSVTYVLSSSSELSNSSDNWTLDLSNITPLPLGTYQVVATSTDADGSLSDTSSNELVITEYSADWWDTNWTKCRNITIANTGTATLSNFPAYIDLAYDSDMQSTYNDIRFINTSCANGGFELDFEIETYTLASADVWVEIDNLPTAGTTIAVYYGNASATSGENINGTWISSHKGVWHLSENTSATNQDSTSNSNNGTPQNSPVSTSGKIGKALDFDVTNETLIDLGTDDSLDLSTGNSPDWTISLWVKPFSDFGDRSYPIMYQYGSYGASVGLDKDNGEIEHWRNDATALYNNTNLNINAWNHVVVTRDNSLTRFYLNGNANGSGNSVAINETNFGSHIGGYPEWSGGDLKGLIDEVRVSNVVRTPDWIKQSYDLVQDQNDHVTIGDEVEPEPDPELGQCSAIFPDGASTHSVGGTINFEYNSQLFGSDDNQLATTAITKNGGLNTCDTSDCVATGTPSGTVATVNFQTTASTIDVTVGNNDAKTIGTGTGDLSGYEYKDINGSSEATITFSDAHNEYWVDTLALGFKNTLFLQAGGTYWINQLTMGSQVDIIVQGSGTALIYVNQSLTFPSPGLINSPSNNNTGDASKLVMYVLSDVTFNNQSTYTGSLYAEGNLILISSSHAFGAVSAANIQLDSSSTITYQSSEVAGTDFMGMCDVFAPLLEYRFDELIWYGTAGELIDSSINSLNGQSVGGTLSEDAQLCTGATFDGVNDHFVVPPMSTDFSSGFSAMAWVDFGSANNWERIFDFGNGAANNNIVFARQGSTNHLHFEIFNGGASCGNIQADNGIVSGRHHYAVAVASDNTVVLYRDGAAIKSGTTACLPPNVTRNINYIGRSNWNNEYFESEIDELKIFDSTLTATNISNIYNNENAGNNYDGTTRSCPVIACGTLDAVGIKIGSGGGSSDSEINTTSEALAIHAAWLTASSPATGSIDTGGDTYNVTASGSSEVDRIDFGGYSQEFAGTLPYPGADTGVGDEDFLVHTSGTLSLPAGDYTIYVESDDGFNFVMDTVNGDTVSFSKFGNSSSGANNELRHENTTGNSNTGGSFTLTQDSVFDISAIFFERDGGDYIEISISNDIRTNEAPSGYEILRHGALNEKVKFGQCAVTSQIDHYRIEHDAQGFTCEAENLTIKACADANCDTLYDEETSITLSPSGWSDGDTLIFTGEFPTSISVQDEGSITLAKTGATPEADLRCFNGSNETCSVAFSDDGFELYGENTGDTLPDQLAANNFQNVNLRAVRSNNNVCEALLEGTQNVDLTYDCNSPDTCITPLNGISITGDGSGGNTGSIEVEFNDQGVASLALLNYPDAGRLILSIEAEVEGVSITNSDNEAVDVYPSYLQMTVEESELIYGNSGEQNNYVAAEPFNFSIGAYGVNDVLLPNYQTENPQLKVTRIQPASTGSNGHFKYSNIGTTTAQLAAGFTTATGLSFSDGEHQYAAAYYDEVGRIAVDVRDNMYLGNVILSNGSLTLGDFYPAYFDVTITDSPSLADTCSTFSYMGENITFATNPELTITAYNALNVITENYSDVYWNYLPNESTLEANLSFIDSSTYAKDDSASVTDLGDAPVIASNDNYNGSGTVTINNGKFQYNKVDPDDYRAFAPTSPFDAKINLTFASNFFTSVFIDQNGNQDTICYQASYTDNFCLSLDIDDVTGTQMRYGRLTLESTYGPETESLNVPIKAEYFKNNQWLLNSNDNCTTIEFTQEGGEIQLTNNSLAAEVGDVTSQGTLMLGVPVGDQLTLDAPDISGKLNLWLNPSNADVTWPAYLNYDWDGDGFINSDDFPKSTITFGQFRGSDRIIHWREVFN